MNISFDNSYARLPDRFYARLNPTPVAEPKLVRVNAALAPVQVALLHRGVPVRPAVDPGWLERTGVRAALGWLRLAVRPDRMRAAEQRVADHQPVVRHHAAVAADGGAQVGVVGDVVARRAGVDAAVAGPQRLDVLRIVDDAVGGHRRDEVVGRQRVAGEAQRNGGTGGFGSGQPRPGGNGGGGQPGNPAVGQPVSFDGRTSSDSDGTIVTYRWIWGDGTPDGSGQTPTHAFATAGNFSTVLIVTDNDGQTGAAGHGIGVGGPTAAYIPSTYAPKVGATVSFDGRASSDSNGTITAYRWGWGDGTPDGSGSTPTHVFTAAGTRSVALYVTDGNGQTAAVGHGLTVSA